MLSLWTIQPLTGAYRKEHPVGLIVAADGGQYQPSGTETPLKAYPGLFLFQGDMLYGAGGSMRLLWCPEGAARKFEYTIQGSTRLTLDHSLPSLGQGKELDVCALPALERTPEVTTLPPLDQMLPPPLPASTLQQHIAGTPPDTAAALQALAGRDLTDPRIRISFATMLSKAALDDDAVDQFGELARLWPDDVRIGRLILDLLHSGSTREIVQPKVPTPNVPPSQPGKTYALVIGINEYANPDIQPLHFAAADATEFARFMASARGGSAEVVKLVNEGARVADIRNNMTSLLAKLRKDDTFVLFIAGHGTMRGDIPTALTYFSNPQESDINDFPLTEIQKNRFGEVSPFRQVRVFLDICHAGDIAMIEPPAPKKGAPPPPQPLKPPKQFLYATATHQGPDALAYEDSIFGHGVFSYFLLRGLESGEAHAPDSHFVTAVSLKNYLATWVEHATTSAKDKQPRQSPDTFLFVPLGYELANIDVNGPDKEYPDKRPLASLVIPDERLGKRQRQVKSKNEPVSNPPVAPAEPPPNLDRRIALEDEGETILLRYLEGDEIPQRVEDFRRCASIYTEALSLQPGSPYLEARRVFCVGRALVFEKRYDAAIERLERAIRLDPAAAYSYNALGIAYLEKGDYTMARAAFDDAIGRAPKWAYPRHNLALVHTETGNYDLAIAAYRDAMARAPGYSYLHYNLGLLFQRMNRLDDAEAEYLLAIQKAGRCEPYVALGALKASQKKWKDAEKYYRKALTITAEKLTLQTLRHNFAAMLARNDAGWPEAKSLLQQNGNYVPSQLLLAESLARRGQDKDAIQLYRAILSAVPEHLSSRLLLAAELQKTGDFAPAIGQLRTALSLQPDNPVIFERLAASLVDSGEKAEASALLRLALSYSDPGMRMRIEKALKRLEQAR